jgi:hypothetical protein
LWDVKIYFRGFSMEEMLRNTAQTMSSSFKCYYFIVRQLLFFFLYSFFLLPEKGVPLLHNSRSSFIFCVLQGSATRFLMKAWFK